MVRFVLSCMVLGAVSAVWAPEHGYTPSVSAQIAAAIKQKLLDGMNKFSNQDFAKKLKSDLEQKDDSKRSLKEIDAASATQLFSILKLDDPSCDKNSDGVVKGDQLKCLNFAWKAFMPE